MRSLAEGNIDSLGELFERYKTGIFNYFLRSTGDRDAASDMLMEVFERLYRYRESYQPDRKFRPWLFRIANRVLADHFRTQNRSLTLLDISVESTDELSWQGDIEVHQRYLLSALKQLGEQDQRLIQLHYMLEMSYAEIAEIEDLTVNALRIRICRALKKLNQLLKETGIKH